MKKWMYKTFTINGNHTWYNIIQDIVNKYNNKVHSSIKYKPKDVYLKDIELNELPVEKAIGKSKFRGVGLDGFISI